VIITFCGREDNLAFADKQKVDEVIIMDRKGADLFGAI